MKNKKKITFNNINDKIKADKIRLNDSNGKFIGIFNLKDALIKSKEKKLDLVEINSNFNPPICKLMDYNKYMYKKKKLVKKNKKKQKIIQIKEINFRPVTNSNDYNIKIKKIINFLKKGNKIKISLKFKGREINHKHLGIEILNRIKKNINENLNIVNIDFLSKEIENRQMIMIISFKNNKN
ncbi:translation initiation factor IF-3 [Enterobacterales bacterium endosymbiont of Anomoneura mori]|uniref:translation initiation factor IF-3 n=1 Tax=Enterobacterales bacterium endosymbiont of Anomoneura mori TaxID=3132096 RepID=UPI00399C5E2D